MPEDQVPSNRSEGTMNSQKQGNNNTTKRKRIDARIYKEYYISQAKKHKVSSEPKTECSNVKLGTSLSLSVKQRVDSEGNSQPNGEKIWNIGPNVSEAVDQDQASSSTDVLLHGRTYGEMVKDLVPCAYDRSEDLPDCQNKMPRYIEYWVPVGLSYVQLEKYCEILIKNSLLLCSSLKNEVLDSVRAILTMIKKCCDHPYLVDSSLQKFVNDRHSAGDYLSNGIEVSGKLFLLDKLLQEIKRRQLRALIVFQLIETKSRSNNLQHFLDDFICEKVGEECYVHIYREFDPAKRRAQLDLFNDKESRKLVMLIERSSCQSSIKLSSVDCVILFNSDWRPMNDMNSLRKMSIQSNSDHLKVFRLYSSHTVEEKALFLAKEGTTLESNMYSFSHSITHMLLLWGMPYLSSKLDELHGHSSSIGNLNCLCEDKLALDVVRELSAILSCEGSDSISCSLISKVPETKDDYSQNIALHGEQDEPARDADLPPLTIWSSLLEGRNPLWKFIPGSLERMRRKGEILASPAQYVECNNVDVKMTSRRTSHSGDGFLSLKPRLRKVCRSASGHLKSLSNAVKLSSGRGDCSSPSMTELILKQKGEIHEFYRTKRKEKEKLDEQHQLEVDHVIKNHKETAIKQEQLKKLKIIYVQKLEEHNRVMDLKRKELVHEHKASRKKKKQPDEFVLLKTKNLGTPTTSLANSSVLETALERKTVDLIENPIGSVTKITYTAPVSDIKQCPEIELGMVNSFVQQEDPEISPDYVRRQTEILSVASDEQNDAVLMLIEEVSDTADYNIETPIEACLGEAEMRGATDSDTSATVIVQQRVEADGASNGEFEIRDSTASGTSATPTWQQSMEEVPDGECNIVTHVGSSSGEAEMRVTASLDSTATVAGQQRVEAVLCGDSNNKALVRDLNGEAEMIVVASSVTSNTVAGKQRIEELQCGVFNTEASTRVVSNWEANNGGEDIRVAQDLGTTSTVAGHQRIEEQQCGDSNIEAHIESSNGVPETRVALDSSTTSTLAGNQRIEEVQDGEADIESPFGEYIREAELRGAPDPGTTATLAVEHAIEATTEFPSSRLIIGNEVMVHSQACTMIGFPSPDLATTDTVAGQQRIEELTEFTSSRLNVGSQVVVQSQSCTMTGNSSQDLSSTASVAGQQRIEELMEFPSSRLNFCRHVLVQSQACTMTGNPSPLQQPMVPTNLPRNLIGQTAGAADFSNCHTLRVGASCQTQVSLGNLGSCDQPATQSLLQLSTGWEQPRCQHPVSAANLQSANISFPESSRYRLLPAAGSDPFQNELVRLKKEEEIAVKMHEDKTKHLKSSCDEEILEVQKKYDLLLKEAEDELTQKKLELGSHCRKVEANKFLAYTLQSSMKKQTSSPVSPEDLSDAILRLYPQQLKLGAHGTSLQSAEAIPPQVVHQFSELVSVDTTIRQNFSALHHTRDPLAGYHARSSAPHLFSSRPVTSGCAHNTLTSMHGVMDQQTAVWPRGSVLDFHQQRIFPGSSLQIDSTMQNPLLLQLSGMLQNPVLL